MGAIAALASISVFWPGHKAAGMDEAEKDRLDVYPTGQKIWRCYHCDEVFTDRTSAACQISEQEIRKMEDELRHYRNEDTQLHREIARLHGEHQIALRRAEESGYAKGWTDRGHAQ